MLEDVFLSLGSNLGNRSEQLRMALEALKKNGVRIERCSSLYETEPVDYEDQPRFLNLVCMVWSDDDPLALLDCCKKIEEKLGRTPSRVPKGPRLIDIDIIAYGDRILESDRLTIPHPAMADRRFVLVPLSEIAPGFKDPKSGRPLKELLSLCLDRTEVTRVAEPPV